MFRERRSHSGSSLLGFVLPVISAITHASNVFDCMIWSVVALIVQVIVYFVVRIPVPDLSNRIAKGRAWRQPYGLGAASLGRGASQRRLDDLREHPS